MRTDLVADALRMACIHRRPPAGVIFHSDRAVSQYTSHEYAALAAALGVTLSLGRKGECWDWCFGELVRHLQDDLIYTRRWPTLACLRHSGEFA